MILGLAETPETTAAVAQSPTLWFQLNRQRLSRTNTVQTIISSQVRRLLLSLSSFKISRLLANNSNGKSILKHVRVPAFDESELSTRQSRPGDGIVPHFTRSVSAIIGLWSFYGDFWTRPARKFSKMLSVPANSVFWPQPVNFLGFLGRFPFSVPSSPFATVEVFQPTCHSRGMDGGQGQQLVVLVRF
jgi:hypothetical protein